MLYHSWYAFLWSVIRPYRWYYLVMMMAPIIGAFYEFANQYSLKLLIDAFSQTEVPSYQVLIKPIVIFVSAQILIDVVWRTADIAEWRSEPYVRRSILLSVYDFVQYHSYPFFQNTPIGTITSKIKGILDGYDNFWASLHHDFTPRVANTIVLTAVLAVVNLKIFLFVSLWGICFFIIMYRFSKHLNELSFINANHRHGLFGLISDNITNIFTLFSFASRKQELGRLDKKIVQDFIPSNIRVYKFSFFTNVFGAVAYWVMLISLFLFMIHLRRIGAASSGDLVFVMGITLSMSMDLWRMIQKMQDFMRNLGDFKSAFEILQVPQDKQEQQLPSIKISNPGIVFDNVSFSYEANKPVFRKLCLEIKPGEKIGLVGSSGAGKSTLVALLLKYFKNIEGKILISGEDITTVSADSLRENISVIPQDILLFHRTILENIAYGSKDATEQEVIKAAQLANIHDFIMSLPDQYASLVGERGIKLSGGQRQRIAIARAMLKNAPILILDEATSSLDTEVEKLIQASLNVILENNQITVLAIAHRLSTLKHLDRIIVLDRGEIVEQGRHDILLAKGGLYKKLWEIQQI